MEFGFIDDVLVMIVKKVVECCIGVCGLCLIFEGILFDMMFDLFSMDGVDEVMIDKDVVGGIKELVCVYIKKKELVGEVV